MALNTVLLIAAGMGVNIGLQDPMFNNQFAVPVLDQNSPVIDTAAPQQSSIPVVTQGQGGSVPAPTIFEAYAVEAVQGPKVSVQFTNAKASEVFAWLQKQGASFVVAAGMIPSDATVTLNIVDQPLDSVVNAIATAMGGHWVREGGIKVFRQGPPVFGTFAPAKALDGKPLVPNVPGRAVEVKEFANTFGPDFAKRMELMSKDMVAKFGPEHEKEMQKRFGPDFQKKMALVEKEHAKMALEHHKLMEKEFGPDFQKRMEKMAKEHEKFAVEHQRMMEKEFGPEFQAKVRKMAEEARVQGKLAETRVRVDGKEMRVLAERAAQGSTVEVRDGFIYRTKNGKTEKIPLKEGTMKLDDGTVIRSWGTGKERSITVEGRAGQVARPARVRTVRGTEALRRSEVDAKKFLNSLTPDQKHSQRMKGYVLYMDLTRDQREMLGRVPEGKFEVKLKVNDQEVVVRGS